MTDRTKPIITLSQISSIPDGHLHSKVSFLKSIINHDDNPEMLEMRQKIYKISYTIKNIGIHGEEIGITSKRLPLKSKQDYKPSEIKLQKQKQIYKKKYLPHNSFYSQALVPVKKHKENQAQHNSSKDLFLVTSSIMNPSSFYRQNQMNADNTQTKFAKKMEKKSSPSKSFSRSQNLKALLNRQSKDKQFLQKVTEIKKSQSEPFIKKLKTLPNRKSYSKLLNQHYTAKKQVQMLPLQHQQNPLFKKIKRLQQLNVQRMQQLSKRTQSLRNISRSSTVFMGRYNAMSSTARVISSRLKRKQ